MLFFNSFSYQLFAWEKKLNSCLISLSKGLHCHRWNMIIINCFPDCLNSNLVNTTSIDYNSNHNNDDNFFLSRAIHFIFKFDLSTFSSFEKIFHLLSLVLQYFVFFCTNFFVCFPTQFKVWTQSNDFDGFRK